MLQDPRFFAVRYVMNCKLSVPCYFHLRMAIESDRKPSGFSFALLES